MELTPYLDGLRRDLTAAAAPGGPDVTRAAELLSGSLESSVRLTLLEVLSDAAAEITTKLDHITVDVQLRGRDAQLVVTDATPPAASTPAEPATGEADPGDLVRVTLRLSEGLKEAVERMAAASGMSVNAWLVRAITRAVSGEPGPPPHGLKLGKRVTGFAQS